MQTDGLPLCIYFPKSLVPRSEIWSRGVRIYLAMKAIVALIIISMFWATGCATNPPLSRAERQPFAGALGDYSDGYAASNRVAAEEEFLSVGASGETEAGRGESEEGQTRGPGIIFYGYVGVALALCALLIALLRRRRAR